MYKFKDNQLREHTKALVRKSIKKQLSYLSRDLAHIDAMLAEGKLGRPKKNEARDEKQDYRDECERVEVERRFTLAKRKCGLGLIMTKLEETISHSIAMSVVVLNLRKIQRTLLRVLLDSLDTLGFTRKIVFLQ